MVNRLNRFASLLYYYITYLPIAYISKSRLASVKYFNRLTGKLLEALLRGLCVVVGGVVVVDTVMHADRGGFHFCRLDGMQVLALRSSFTYVGRYRSSV
jgi:hypothetical protein